MHEDGFAIQDASVGHASRVLRLIGEYASATEFTQVRVSVAYASLNGCKELEKRLLQTSESWVPARKLWLVGIDFGQTSPAALRFLSKLKNSRVRIPNGAIVLENKLQPKETYHPKTFVFENVGKKKSYQAAMICGSANLTYGGMRSNAEHIHASRCWRVDKEMDSTIISALAEFDQWWVKVWAASTALDAAFLKEYEAIHDATAKLQDAEETTQAFVSEGPHEIEEDEGLGWAAARCFWIETQELYKNRGPVRPGNQLDCRRGTRVYFGFSPASVLKNTVLGHVNIQFDGNESQSRSIRYADNSMDKVNLPIPNEYGPPSYDNSVLHFERIGRRLFELTLGDVRLFEQWKSKSEKQGMLYSFAGGRRYGFYS